MSKAKSSTSEVKAEDLTEDKEFSDWLQGQRGVVTRCLYEGVLVRSRRTGTDISRLWDYTYVPSVSALYYGQDTVSRLLPSRQSELLAQMGSEHKHPGQVRVGYLYTRETLGGTVKGFIDLKPELERLGNESYVPEYVEVPVRLKLAGRTIQTIVVLLRPKLNEERRDEFEANLNAIVATYVEQHTQLEIAVYTPHAKVY